MKFLTVGFLFAILLSAVYAMAFNMQNQDAIGNFKPAIDGGPSCHRGHGRHSHGPGSLANSTETTVADAEETTDAN